MFNQPFSPSAHPILNSKLLLVDLTVSNFCFLHLHHTVAHRRRRYINHHTCGWHGGLRQRAHQAMSHEGQRGEATHGVHGGIIQMRCGVQGTRRAQREQLADVKSLGGQQFHCTLHGCTESGLEILRGDLGQQIIDGSLLGNGAQVQQQRGASQSSDRGEQHHAAVHRADKLRAEEIRFVRREDRIDTAHHRNGQCSAGTVGVQRHRGAGGQHILDQSREEVVQGNGACGEDHESVAATDGVRHGCPDDTTTKVARRQHEDELGCKGRGHDGRQRGAKDLRHHGLGHAEHPHATGGQAGEGGTQQVELRLAHRLLQCDIVRRCDGCLVGRDGRHGGDIRRMGLLEGQSCGHHHGKICTAHHRQRLCRASGARAHDVQTLR
mmetsp:Transcript_40764/g.70585  ORF Transcript_40764/g.70585 Transcript_40764/m.70585 type:complete len:380 (+) Transcript_40764:232-1371(+)